MFESEDYKESQKVISELLYEIEDTSDYRKNRIKEYYTGIIDIKASKKKIAEGKDKKFDLEVSTVKLLDGLMYTPREIDILRDAVDAAIKESTNNKGFVEKAEGAKRTAALDRAYLGYDGDTIHIYTGEGKEKAIKTLANINIDTALNVIFEKKTVRNITEILTEIDNGIRIQNHILIKEPRIEGNDMGVLLNKKILELDHLRTLKKAVKEQTGADIFIAGEVFPPGLIKDPEIEVKTNLGKDDTLKLLSRLDMEAAKKLVEKENRTIGIP